MKPVSSTANALPIDLANLKKAAGILRAANNPLRQKILQFIHQNLRVNVGTIYKKLKIEQSVASQHLGILRSAKLVSVERDGKHIYYSINYEKVKLLLKTAAEMIIN
jgi:DNA-binding transcriptional ArsR family regulator